MLPIVLYSWLPSLLIYLIWVIKRKPFRSKKVYLLMKMGFTIKC